MLENLQNITHTVDVYCWQSRNYRSRFYCKSMHEAQYWERWLNRVEPQTYSRICRASYGRKWKGVERL